MSQWNVFPINHSRERLRGLKSVVDASGSVIPCLSATVEKTTSSSGNRMPSNNCSRCPNYSYSSTDEFREHSRSEWHLRNVRNPGNGVSFEVWSMENLSDAPESDSCSTSSEEEHTSPTKLLILGIPWRLVYSGRAAVPEAVPSLEILLEAPFVCVLLLRSGRFAGAVWDSLGNVVVHTSFKRYTVRRRNGGSQSKNDNSKGSPANSVGAQIRRAQERRLTDDLFELITDAWKAYFCDERSVVFAYSSKSLKDELLVGPLEKGHRQCHVLPVPVSVRNPSFAEVCRVYSVLASVAFPKE